MPTSGIATVCRITHIEKHPNADRLLLATVLGSQVIVGLEQHINELGVVFDTDCQLSEEFCDVHDLVERHDPETGKKVGGGFFDKSRRVRPKNFRGIKSHMYFVPLSWFEYTGQTEILQEGDQFQELNGHPICTKYIVKRQKQPGVSRQKSYFTLRKRNRCPKFLEHFDTQHLRHALGHTLYYGTRIIVTNKIHATSQRLGFLPDENPVQLLVKFPWKLRNKAWFSWAVDKVEGWTNKFYKMLFETQYKHFVGSRRVNIGTLEDNVVRQGYHGKEKFRYDVVRHLYGRLVPGETLYFEVCHTNENGEPLMPSVPVEKLPKECQSLYPNPMRFTYGVQPGETKMFVYRITHTDRLTGQVRDLSWEDVKGRCTFLNISTVPEVMKPLTIQHERSLGELFPLESMEVFVNGPDPLDKTHMKEGVCIRVESHYGSIMIYKHKSFDFLVAEGLIKDQGIDDIEELASLEGDTSMDLDFLQEYGDRD